MAIATKPVSIESNSDIILHTFDPGVSTGYACVILHNGQAPTVVDTLTLPLDNLSCFGSIEGRMRSVRESGGVQIVVYEEFRLFPGAAVHLIWNSMPAVNAIGVIRYICYLNNITPELQQPSNIKNLGLAILRSKFQFLGEYKWPPATEHERDALRHALFYWATNHRISTQGGRR